MAVMVMMETLTILEAQVAEALEEMEVTEVMEIVEVMVIWDQDTFQIFLDQTLHIQMAELETLQIMEQDIMLEDMVREEQDQIMVIQEALFTELQGHKVLLL